MLPDAQNSLCWCCWSVILHQYSAAMCSCLNIEPVFSDWLTYIYDWQSGKVYTRSKTQYDNMSKLKFQNQTIAESNRKLFKFKLNSDDQRGILFPPHKDCCMTPQFLLNTARNQRHLTSWFDLFLYGTSDMHIHIEIYSFWAFFEFLGSNCNGNSSCYFFFS